jgi:5-methylthioribose kinase
MISSPQPPGTTLISYTLWEILPQLHRGCQLRIFIMDGPNYSRYLESVYQSTQWDVARVPHGSINATLRVVKTEGQAGPQSLILKHASPFFEDEGQLQPFSLNRQVRNATA